MDPGVASGTPWTLESLEADIAAVGSAMETVDRIVAGGRLGRGIGRIRGSRDRGGGLQERFGNAGPNCSLMSCGLLLDGGGN
ncbi:MAG: hypothetical protein M5U19_03315 [Microthrixaceae bacterium]|nr:hypothetical protein [Microthrixaceae bacterium]